MQKDMFLVTPMTQKIYLEAGEVYHGSVRIANPNNSTRDFRFKVGISPYGVAGEDYNADLATRTNRTMIADWITLDTTSGILSPNDTIDVGFTITVPTDAPAGAQYAAIVVNQDEESAKSSGIVMDNVFEIASLIYAEVAGETIHGGSILSNTIPGFSTTGEVIVSSKFENHGNVHDTADIIITIKNNLTGEVILPTEGNNGQFSELIIPDTTRNVERRLDNLPLLGAVHVEQTIYYNGQTSKVEQDIIICPLWFIVIVIITLGIFITIITRIIHKNRKRKQIV